MGRLGGAPGFLSRQRVTACLPLNRKGNRARLAGALRWGAVVFVNPAPLESEQDELLAILIEASRAVPRDQRHPFLFIEFFGGSKLVHDGMAAIGREMYQPNRSDLDTLYERGLVRLRPSGGSGYSVDVTPEGFRYYEQMQARRGTPMIKAVTAARDYLESESFRRRHERAAAKWEEADRLLWSADSQKADTTIGHLCREAMQLFATDLVDAHKVEADPDPQHTNNRVRAVLAARIRSEKRLAWAKALVAYWEAVADLTQRQEHAGVRDKEALVLADSRRLVTQTLMVMYELDHELQLPVES
jgi:hypothetical protein